MVGARSHWLCEGSGDHRERHSIPTRRAPDLRHSHMARSPSHHHPVPRLPHQPDEPSPARLIPTPELRPINFLGRTQRPRTFPSPPPSSPAPQASPYLAAMPPERPKSGFKGLATRGKAHLQG